MDEKIDKLDRNFNKSSWFNAINIGWEGGVHIQSCGHYLHLDCHCSYMQSLKASRLRNRNSSDNGEFSCPLCRQMANSVLPINPDLNKKTNLKSYLKQRQFNLNKKQDFSSVNQHVAKMFELLAFNSASLNNEDDEDLMNIATNEDNQNNANESTENTSSSTSTTNTPNTPSSSSNTDVEFKDEREIKVIDTNIQMNQKDECTVDSPSIVNCGHAPKFNLSTTSNLFNVIPFVMSPESLMRETCLELMSLYTRIPTPDSNLLKSFGFFCEDLTKATGPQYRSVKTSPTPHALYLFMCSILRTNLETELLVKLSKSSPTGAKKSCFIPLFHVLALNCHFLIPQYYTSLWSQLTGLEVPDDFRESIVQVDKEVPLLLVDTCAILIQLLFALPLNVDEKYYDSIVQNLYNLTVFQSFSQISCFFTKDERKTMIQQMDRDELFNCPINMISYVISYYENHNSNLFSHMDTDDDQLMNKKWRPTELRDLAINMCLPFIRLATLLKCFLFNRDYPTFNKMTDEQFKKAEYFNLIRVLNLKTPTNTRTTEEDAFVMPYFVCDQPNRLLDIWLGQYSIFVEKALSDAIVSLSFEFHFQTIHFANLNFFLFFCSFTCFRNYFTSNQFISLVLDCLIFHQLMINYFYITIKNHVLIAIVVQKNHVSVFYVQVLSV